MNILSFLSYVMVGTFTPGPNNVMAMSNASRYGFKKSIGYNLGVGAGFFVVSILCAIFTKSLYNYIPAIKPIMTFIGFFYMLFLAWKIFKSKHSEEDKKNTKTNSFFLGVILQFINPKGIIYGITIMSIYIIPHNSSIFIITLLIIFISAICILSTSLWGLFGSVFQRFIFKNEKFVNTVMSLLLVYCAVSLFF